MAVALAVIPALFAAGSAVAAAGSVVAAMSTFTGFLSVAGAALTTIGAVTGKKDLLKIGGFMALGGGIGSAMSSAGGAAASSGAQEALRASELAAQGGSAASMAAPIAETALPALTMEPAGSVMTDFGQFKLPLAQQAAEKAGSSVGGMDLGFDSIMGKLNLADKTNLAAPSVTQAVPLQPAVQSASSKIADGGQSMTMADLQGYVKSGYEATKPIASGALDFMRNNKELVNMGGNMLSSMYGPQAEQMDMNKSIYERRMRNLNSPVKLNFGGA